ncbi:MAG: methionine synthase [Clostridia bacterium]
MLCFGKGMVFPIDIDKNEVLRTLGYRGGELQEEYYDKIEFYSCLVKEKSTCRVEFAVYDIKETNPVRIEGTDIKLMGKDIAKHLEGCKSCCFMSATLGSEIDRLIRIKNNVDVSDALILDACASVGVESLCDNAQGYIEKELLKNNMYITDRFSPGYGDFPIGTQKDICEATQSHKMMGLSYTQSFLLTPFKSVTAVIGISDAPRKKRITGCKNCFLSGECQYRKRGVTCYE